MAAAALSYSQVLLRRKARLMPREQAAHRTDDDKLDRNHDQALHAARHQKCRKRRAVQDGDPVGVYQKPAAKLHNGNRKQDT